MLKKIIKITAVVLCAVLLVSPVLTSCGAGGGGKPAMSLTYGGKTTDISSNIYSYYMSYTKTMMLYQYWSAQGQTDTTQMSDVPGIWTAAYPNSASIPGVKTYDDYAKLQAETQVENLLACVVYCQQKNLTLSKAQLNTIDVNIKDMINNDFNRSASQFESTLARFGINESIFRQIKKYEAMQKLVQTYLFDPTTGKTKITDDMINQFYTKNCVRMKHILMLLTPGTKDVNGNPESYSADELAQRNQKADDIYNSIKNGKDFDSFITQSEDPGMTADGYTIAKNTNFVPEFITAAFDMKIGEVRKVQSSYGWHIMERLDLLPADQAVNPDTGKSWKDYISQQMQALALDETLKSYTDNIKVDTAQTNLFTISSSDTMFDCLQLLQ